MNKIILASKSEVRKKILLENGILCDVEPSKVDEDVIKESLLKEGATPEIISVCNYSDKAQLVMKNFNDSELKNYLSKISDKNLYAYNVYQIEGEGKKLFSEVKGDKNTIMGLPVTKIKSYLQEHK